MVYKGQCGSVQIVVASMARFFVAFSQCHVKPMKQISGQPWVKFLLSIALKIWLCFSVWNFLLIRLLFLKLATYNCHHFVAFPIWTFLSMQILLKTFNEVLQPCQCDVIMISLCIFYKLCTLFLVKLDWNCWKC